MPKISRNPHQSAVAHKRKLAVEIAALAGVPSSSWDVDVPYGELKQHRERWPDCARALLIAERAATLARRAHIGPLEDDDTDQLEALWQIVNGFGRNDDPAKRNILFDAVAAVRPEYEKVIAYAAAASLRLEPKKKLSLRDAGLLRELPAASSWAKTATDRDLRQLRDCDVERELHASAMLRGYQQHYPKVANKLRKHPGLLLELLDSWGERRPKRGMWVIASELMGHVGLGAAPGTLKVAWSDWRAKVRSQG